MDNMDETLEKFQKIKRQLAEKQREADKAQGAIDEIEKQLKKEFDCSTVAEANQLLRKLSVSEADARELFEKKFRRFEKTWEEFLDG